MKNKVIVVIFLISFSCIRPLSASELVDPFAVSKNNIATESIHFANIQLHVPQVDAYQNYLDLRIIQPKPDHSDDMCHRPVLIFLGGFVLGLDWTSYQTLLTELAKRNITVIYPEYLPKSSIGKAWYILFGYDSQKLTDRVQKTVAQYISEQYAQCKAQPNVVLYSHSFGTRVAAGLANENKLNIKGLILDSVVPQEDEGMVADKQKLCLDTAPGKVDTWHLLLSVIHFQMDHKTKQGTDRTYSQCNADYKQYLEINSYTDDQGHVFQADHFSPFSDSKEKDISFRSKAEKLHGYVIHMGWDIIDEVSTLPLLTALAWASFDEKDLCNGSEKTWLNMSDSTDKVSTCDFAKNVHHWAVREIYGENRDVVLNGQKIREMKSMATDSSISPIKQ